MRITSSSLAPILASSDMRNLSRHQRAVKLMTEHHASLRVAAQCSGLGIQAVNCAQRSYKTGKPLGRRGAPPLLNDAIMGDFKKMVEEANKLSKGFSMAEARERLLELIRKQPGFDMNRKLSLDNRTIKSACLKHGINFGPPKALAESKITSGADLLEWYAETEKEFPLLHPSPPAVGYHPSMILNMDESGIEIRLFLPFPHSLTPF